MIRVTRFIAIDESEIEEKSTVNSRDLRFARARIADEYKVKTRGGHVFASR